MSEHKQKSDLLCVRYEWAYLFELVPDPPAVDAPDGWEQPGEWAMHSWQSTDTFLMVMWMRTLVTKGGA